MKITRITVNNLHSLRLQATIDFSSPPLAHAGLIAITGDTGAGKTTLLDAITLALYGRIHRNKDAKDVMSYGAVESLAEVEFETHKGLFRAKWSIWRAHRKEEGDIKGPKRELAQWNPRLEVFEIIAEKNKEVDDMVEAVSGLDYDRFCRSVLLSQGDFAAFLKSGEKERSDLLERITGVEIYSRLSMAAYERAKLEQQRLDDLRQTLGITQAPTSDELAQWEKELAQYQLEGKALADRRALLLLQSQWLQRLTELETRRSVLHQALQDAEQGRSEDADIKIRIQDARKASAFQPDLALLDNLTQRIIQLEAELLSLDEQIHNAQRQLEGSQQEQISTQQTLEELQKEFQTQYPVWEKTLALDAVISEKTLVLQSQQLQLAAQEKTGDELKRQLEQQATQLSELEQLEHSCAEWLSAHNAWQSLPRQLPLMQDKRNELRILWAERKTAIDKDENARSQLIELSKQLEQAANAKAEAEAQLQQLQADFERLAPEYYATSRQELLHLLVQEIEGLSDKQGQLRLWGDVQKTYQQKLKAIADLEERLYHLQLEEEDVNKTLMVAIDALDACHQRLQYADRIYDQQRLIANYEKDREQLQDGEPCPLCFSTHHPFREHHIKPMVDEAKSERDKAQLQYSQALGRQQQLLRQHNELYHETRRLRGKEEGLERLRLDLLDIEAELVATAGTVFAGMPGIHENPRVEQLIEQVNQSLTDKRSRRQQLMELDKSLAALEKSVSNTAQTYAQAQSAHLLAQERAASAAQWRQETETKWEQSVAQMNNLLEPYGQVFEAEKGAAIFETLQQQADEYARRQKQLDEAVKDKAAKAQRMEQFREEMARLQENLGAARSTFSIQQQILNETVAERRALLGEEDPQVARTAMQAGMTQQQLRVDQTKSTCATLEKELESLRRLHAGKSGERTTAYLQKDQLSLQLLSKLQQSGFDNIEALQQSLMSHDALQQLEETLQQREQRRLELEQQWRELSSQLALEQAKALTAESAETVAALLSDTDLRYQSTLQTIGALREKKNQGEQRRSEAQSLLQQISEQEKNCLRWSKLNDVIGQADGKKFRVFAQGLTLQKLTALANRHLQQLNGRYVIYKSKTEDLALEIIDTFQANNKRSMSTLSGGESFLVSLALALGLSDLAGKNAQIQSLFVDEGFGTLDDNSLDMAISTLENLQAAGKTIGVISHVKALKERITTQIQVKMKGNGFSEIAVWG